MDYNFHENVDDEYVEYFLLDLLNNLKQLIALLVSKGTSLVSVSTIDSLIKIINKETEMYEQLYNFRLLTPAEVKVVKDIQKIRASDYIKRYEEDSRFIYVLPKEEDIVDKEPKKLVDTYVEPFLSELLDYLKLLVENLANLKKKASKEDYNFTGIKIRFYRGQINDRIELMNTLLQTRTPTSTEQKLIGHIESMMDSLVLKKLLRTGIDQKRILKELQELDDLDWTLYLIDEDVPTESRIDESRKRKQPQKRKRKSRAGTYLELSEFISSMDEKIVGLEDVKYKLYLLYRKIRTPEQFTQKEISTPLRVMLYGPPGTGKTAIIKAFHELVADEVRFEDIPPGRMLSHFVDGGAEKTENLFEEMKEWEPTLVWIDEFDTLGQTSDDQLHYQQRVNSLKRNLDGMSDFSHIYLFVGTNYPDKIEHALLSRFQLKIEIKLPDLDGRRKIIEITSDEENIEIAEDVKEEFALATEGYSGRNLRDVLINARDLVITKDLAKGNLRPEKRVVTVADIRIAMDQHGKEAG